MKKDYGKFTIDVSDCYLFGNSFKNRRRTAIINLQAKEETVTLEEVSEAICACTDNSNEFPMTIDFKKFYILDIRLRIPKRNNSWVTYNFNILNIGAQKKILFELARSIIL